MHLNAHSLLDLLKLHQGYTTRQLPGACGYQSCLCMLCSACSAQCWWTFIACTVMVALFVDPFSLAFARYPGLYPPAAPDTVFTAICTLLYACDVMLNFFVAYYEEGVLVTDLHRIAGG